MDSDPFPVMETEIMVEVDVQVSSSNPDAPMPLVVLEIMKVPQFSIVFLQLCLIL